MKKELKCDNNENSIALMHELKSELNNKEYNSFCCDINEIIGEGNNVSITSVLKEYDVDDRIINITVGYRNETDKEKLYTYFDVKQKGGDDI